MRRAIRSRRMADRSVGSNADSEVHYPDELTPVSKAFRATLDLFQTGVDLMRQNLRRRYPNANDQDIERLLHEWLLERPGAEAGDAPGRAVDLNTRLA